MENIEQIERRLWEAADQLRANSKLTSTEYYMPVLGLIFLRHAFNRFLVVKEEVEKNLPKRGGVARPIKKDDFVQKSALFLREKSRFDYLLNLPAGKDRGQAINGSMDAIEEDYEGLKGVLPKDYQIFESDVLGRLLKIFNDEALQKASGDVFGKIYEYFLMKFAMGGAQDMGEFFTPISLVQTIVNVIEPDHGTVFDPACGSGGMFVQTSHFLEEAGKETPKVVTFFGQEKTATTIRLAKMNLAVHGLEGKIVEGNTFYEDHHELLGKCDFVMANPPFNVDGVDAEKIKADPRLPFGLPGVNNKGAVSNGNYLWISYFYSYLNPAGRSGFVMSSQGSSAGHGEKEVRRKIVQTGHVDVMISIRSNFFYTRTVPCELWFLDKGKPKDMRDKVLMIDARNIYRKVSRKIYDFSPEQLKNICAVVWLYRGKTGLFLKLIKEYFESFMAQCAAIGEKLEPFEKTFDNARRTLIGCVKAAKKDQKLESEKIARLADSVKELETAGDLYLTDRTALLVDIEDCSQDFKKSSLGSNKEQHKLRKAFDPIAEKVKGVSRQVEHLNQMLSRAMDVVGKEINGIEPAIWDSRAINKMKKELDQGRKDAVEQLNQAAYFHKQIVWLQTRFPEAKLANVEGLVKLVGRKEIEANDWSLTPGRYVGVAPQEEDDGFNFEEAMREIHAELAGFNEEAAQLAKKIQRNFEELGI